MPSKKKVSRRDVYYQEVLPIAAAVILLYVFYHYIPIHAVFGCIFGWLVGIVALCYVICMITLVLVVDNLEITPGKIVGALSVLSKKDESKKDIDEKVVQEVVKSIINDERITPKEFV